MTPGPYEIHRRQWIPRPIDEVFAFFADAHNLEALTPEWMRFQILTPGPIRIAPGTRIEYKLHWHSVPLVWTTEITRWEPPNLFEDVQRSGPYRSWHHTHSFVGERGGTTMTDRVLYTLPLGWLGRVAHALAVRRDVERIFDYRCQSIERQFGKPAGDAA